jgi:hypothetical protein
MGLENCFFLGITGLIFLLFGTKIGLLLISYVAAFPIIFVLWKIPSFILRRKSWTLAFASANTVIYFFQSIRYRLIVSTCWLIAFIIVLTSNDKIALYAAILTLIVLLFISYIRRIGSILKPTGIFAVYRKLFLSLRAFAEQNKLDTEMKALAVSDLNKTQLQQWTAKLQTLVLCNRVCLFSARRLRDYQRSGAHVLSSLLICLVLVIMTTLTFAGVHYALYKIDPTSFEATGHPTFFTFFYYSFYTFIFSSIKELAPVSMLSQSAAMGESFIALFLLAIFVSLAFPYRSEHYTRELNDAIADIETEGAWMEDFIKREYNLSGIDDAIAQLQRLEAAFIRAALFLSEASSELQTFVLKRKNCCRINRTRSIGSVRSAATWRPLSARRSRLGTRLDANCCR